MVNQIVSKLSDLFYEKLQGDDKRTWPARSAVMPDADLSMVWPRFALWLLTEEVPQYVTEERPLKSLADVVELYRQWVDRRKPEWSKWNDAYYDGFVDTAATYAARVGAATFFIRDANTTDASYISRVSHYAAEDATYAVYAAASTIYAHHAVTTGNLEAADAAYADSIRRQSEKLIELLKEV
jgi:hypothetical protein